MYRFKIKDSGTGLDIILSRALLGIAAAATLLYQTEGMPSMNFLAAGLLILTAILIKTLITKFKVNKLVILTVGALLLLIVTHSIVFALILLAFGYFTKLLNVQAIVTISNNGVTIKKLLSNHLHQWNEFSNVIVKDNLLSLDFKSNKLIQLAIEESQPRLDENAFYEFCNRLIKNDFSIAS
jgi:hypothetical protein